MVNHKYRFLRKIPPLLKHPRHLDKAPNLLGRVRTDLKWKIITMCNEEITLNTLVQMWTNYGWSRHIYYPINVEQTCSTVHDSVNLVSNEKFLFFIRSFLSKWSLRFRTLLYIFIAEAVPRFACTNVIIHAMFTCHRCTYC